MQYYSKKHSSHSYSDGPFNLAYASKYRQWREQKLDRFPKCIEDIIIDINDPTALTTEDYNAILGCCRDANMAIYRSQAGNDPEKIIPRKLGLQFGLGNLDSNLCADDDGITSLRLVENDIRSTYIPYTNRPISWHTDGYYNPLDKQIFGLLLHCVNRAENGGENALMDHEIAYILLRDENPDYILALMQPDALTIPPNRNQGIEIRSTQTGPVFGISSNGHLHMRYTQRSHNIIWKNDTLLREAIAYLSSILQSDSPYIFRATLEPGYGLISNNVLHNRSGFQNGDNPEYKRLIYRARYYDRIAQS